MNSAPAVLRIPSIEIDSIPCISPSEMLQDEEAYPWATHTPEHSPRRWDVAPSMDCLPEMQMQQGLPYELMQTVCWPYFEQMCCSVAADPCAQAKVPVDSLRTQCEPFFEQMITALHHAQQQPAVACYQPVYYPTAPYYHIDEASTEAEDSCAFNSLFSGQSEGESFDAIENKSEDSSDVEKSVMVCRHWKSKGWCRLESKCKFLHPEDKCGVSAPRACTVAGAIGTILTPSDIIGAEGVAVRRKKRGGKNRSSKGQAEQLSTEEQEDASL